MNDQKFVRPMKFHDFWQFQQNIFELLVYMCKCFKVNLKIQRKLIFTWDLFLTFHDFLSTLLEIVVRPTSHVRSQ